MRRITTYICLVALIFSGIAIGFLLYPSKADSAYATYAMTFDDKPLTLSQPVYLVNDVPMVPMRVFFQMLGAQVNWFPDTQEMTAYRTNAFLKLKIGVNQGFYNGLPVTLKQAPIMIDKQVYLPLETIARAFDLTFAFDGTAAALKNRDTTRYYYLNDTFFISEHLSKMNLNLAFPYGWQKLSDDYYGLKDEYDDYGMRIAEYPNSNLLNLLQYRDLYKKDLIAKHGTAISFQTEGVYQHNHQTFETFGYLVTTPTSERFYQTYMILHDKSVFVFEGSYATTSDLKYTRDTFQNILSTIQFSDQTVMSENEHYIETPAFLSLGTALTTPIMSNEEVVEVLPFVGQMTQFKKVKKVYALVSKGEDTTEFLIPLNSSGSFNTTLYTPFGLGRHNFEIYATPKSGNTDSLLMQFSAINLSDRVTRYLIPSKFIQSNVMEVSSLASILSYEKTSEFFRAKAYFDWIVSELRPEFNDTRKNLDLDKDAPRALRNVVANKKATKLEYNLLLAAMLRSDGIQAKVVAGQIDEVYYFFVEANINGRWVVIDPVSHVMAKKYPKLTTLKRGAAPTPISEFDNYSHIDLKSYHALFEAFTTVE